MQDYLTVADTANYAYEISRSRFICNIAHTKTQDESADFVAKIRKHYSDATHNCYTYIGTPQSNEQKFFDDGEPSGTAGQPMLGVLTKSGLYCVTAVVTRYFGGIKLGAGGLVSAYTKAVADCLAQAKIANNIYSAIYTAQLTYSEYRLAERRLKEIDALILQADYSDRVALTIAISASGKQRLEDYLQSLTQGSDRYLLTTYQYIVY